MTSSKIDKQIDYLDREIEKAKKRGTDTTGLEARRNKLKVKKQMHREGIQ